MSEKERYSRVHFSYFDVLEICHPCTIMLSMAFFTKSDVFLTWFDGAPAALTVSVFLELFHHITSFNHMVFLLIRLHVAIVK